MLGKSQRTLRREQQSLDVEASQEGLRNSIAETERLVGESDRMLKRHRAECDSDDAAEQVSAWQGPGGH
jgi:hypothetical protein